MSITLSYNTRGQFQMHGDEKTDRRQVDGIYPDMNYIFFKGVPKMIQVVDDMHRTSDYITDLRNMTIGFACLSFMGALIFLLRQTRKRSGTNRHERMIMANYLEDQEKSTQPCSGACRKCSESWHGTTMKTSGF
ncbi:unnamed protein product [Cercopithifilaria johnstoni]|uniref:Uncharacterized protein n=1 Tax=Cercopithifilaria johnstoni TaxID=2874296 RepID=A0A8J2Q7G9_9BILA|nr:unnamed protein product [Cercopithifilaria johnstoni]